MVGHSFWEKIGVFFSYPGQKGKGQQNNGKGGPHFVLVGFQTSPAILGIIVENPQKSKNKSTIQHSLEIV